MLQKDVAERLAAKPGNKSYGVLTVILGAYYKIKYLFTVNEQVFFPASKSKVGSYSFGTHSRKKILTLMRNSFSTLLKLDLTNAEKHLKTHYGNFGLTRSILMIIRYLINDRSN